MVKKAGKGTTIHDALLNVHLVSVDDLNLDSANVRRHPKRSIEAIMASLAEFGQRKPLIVQKEGMVVRAGNGMLQAARELGWKQIAVAVVDEDAISAARFAIADNRSAELSVWDFAGLHDQLASLGEPAELVALGFDDDELSVMLETLTTDSSGDAVETMGREATVVRVCWKKGSGVDGDEVIGVVRASIEQFGEDVWVETRW